MTEAAWEIVLLAERADDGMLPLAGGVLEQSATFVAAWRIVSAEGRKWEKQKLDERRR